MRAALAFRRSTTLALLVVLQGGGCKSRDGTAVTSREPVVRREPAAPTPTSGTGLTFPLRPPSPTALQAVPAFAKLRFDRPVLLTHAPGDPTRVYVVEQAGTIRVLDNRHDVDSTHMFADIRANVRMQHDEEGLLGLAFDPEYADNRTLFLYYSASRPRRTQLSRFTVDARGLLDPRSEVELLRVDQPYGNHNGGMIAFGPDGMLYVGIGDGGMAGDPKLAGQDLGTHLAKILRVDVSTGSLVAPPDNPFVDDPHARPEIWAYGVRNPWRFSFDRLRGTLWLGDVGQGALEEIDIVTRGGNFGWNAREGSRSYARTALRGKAIEPVMEYGRREGESVTGGYVYRGVQLPAYRGAYFYGDYATGTVWALVYNGERVISNAKVAAVPQLSSFGEDAEGELYAVSLEGTIYRFDPAGDGDAAGFPTRLSQTGLFTDTAALTPSSKLLAYDVAIQLWSDGAAKQRWLALPDGGKIEFSTDGQWGFPVGTVAVKHFELGGKRLETRVMVHERLGWAGYTYRWDAAQRDAALMGGPDSARIGAQVWEFPAGTGCLRCHTPGYGELLGIRTRQLSRATLTDWNARKLFTKDIGDPAALPQHPAADTGVAARARAYLDVNCAPCHHPGGPAPGSMDLRVTTSLSASGMLAAAEDKVGLPAERRVAPANHAASAVWARMNRRGDKAMPPLASNVIDSDAVALVQRWIDALPVTDRD